MTTPNAYVCVPRQERLNERRATFLAATIGAAAAIAFMTTLYYSMDAIRNIRSCGDKALAGYDTKKWLDKQPTRTMKEIRKAIEETGGRI